MGILALFLILRDKILSVFHHVYTVSCGPSMIGLYYGISFLPLVFKKNFIMKICGTFFRVSTLKWACNFMVYSVNVVYHTDHYNVINQPYISESTPLYYSVWYLCYWIKLADVFWGLLHVYSPEILSYSVPFWCCVFLASVQWNYWPYTRNSEVFSFWKVLNMFKKLCVNVLCVWLNSLMKLSDTRLFSLF